MHMEPINSIVGLRRDLLRVAVALLLALGVIGCKGKPAQNEGPIALPSLGGPNEAPRGVYAVIRRVDVPLNEPTDAAWAVVNEDMIPPLIRGAWRGNGFRIGILDRSQLNAYSEAMPQPISFGESAINRSDYLNPILESPKLRSDLSMPIDLTRPPKPRHVETIRGGENSIVRLLAQIQTDESELHSIVLIPQHHIPSPFDLVPRSPLVKMLDGRVYEELTLKLNLGADQIAVVGLYYPWPHALNDDAEQDQQREQDQEAAASKSGDIAPPEELPEAEPNDPAAPPHHLRGAAPAGLTNNTSRDVVPEELDAPPPLATSFGSTLLTGTRIRQQIKTVLLITIEAPASETDSNEPP